MAGYINVQLFADEKTESPTPRRRLRAREKGQVFLSTEIVNAASHLGTVMVLGYLAPILVRALMVLTCTLWAQLYGADPIHESSGMATGAFVWAAAISAAILVTPTVLGVLAGLAQVGFVITGVGITPQLERISPAHGIKAIFSRKAAANMLRSVVKVGAISWLFWNTTRSNIQDIVTIWQMSPKAAAAFAASIGRGFLLKAGFVFLAVGFADYAYQWWEYEVSLRMTKQELKEEMKETEGKPEVKSRIKSLQRQWARMRMMSEIKKATVVVTNPTHYAVALLYDMEKMAAPTVVAKGQGYVALRIIEEAKKWKVSVIQNPPLAQVLYKSAEIGEMIPPELYKAVAEVLAYVYRSLESARGLRNVEKV